MLEQLPRPPPGTGPISTTTAPAGTAGVRMCFMRLAFHSSLGVHSSPPPSQFQLSQIARFIARLFIPGIPRFSRRTCMPPNALLATALAAP